MGFSNGETPQARYTAFSPGKMEKNAKEKKGG
jgi:hypothetical protein